MPIDDVFLGVTDTQERIRPELLWRSLVPEMSSSWSAPFPVSPAGIADATENDGDGAMTR
jgi:hypothetical protein